MGFTDLVVSGWFVDMDLVGGCADDGSWDWLGRVSTVGGILLP